MEETEQPLRIEIDESIEVKKWKFYFHFKNNHGSFQSNKKNMRNIYGGINGNNTKKY